MINERVITGRILKVDRGGWGFITSKEIEFTRIFFHWTALRQDTLRFPELKRGMFVDFVPVENQERGWKAIKIRVLTEKEKQAILDKEDAMYANDEEDDDTPMSPLSE